jgi:hypothetical protein
MPGGKDTLVSPSAYPLLLATSQGQMAVVLPQGTLTTPGEYASAMAGASPPPLASESNAPLRVDFRPASGQQHGFDDGSQYPASRQALEVFSIAGQEYRVPWKSIRSWNPDPVEATTTDLDSTADHQPVVFRLGPGNIQPIDNGQGLTLWLSPGGSQQALALEALHGDQPAGRLNIATYDQKVHRLVIVPLGSQVSLPDPLVIRQELDRVYAQAVTAWEVSIDPPLVGKDIPGIDSPLETSGQQSWSAYSPQMNTVIQALLSNRASGSRRGVHLPRERTHHLHRGLHAPGTSLRLHVHTWRKR